jgi:hypothetical protein
VLLLFRLESITRWHMKMGYEGKLLANWLGAAKSNL